MRGRRVAPSPLVTPYRAMLKHPVIVVILVAVGVGAGFEIDKKRDPIYSATAILTVGQPTNSTQSVPGLAAGLESLADSFSRVASSAKVAGITARRLNISPSEVLARVSASKIPQSSLIRVDVIGADKRSTIQLANETSQSIQDYANTQSVDPNVILRQYAAAQRSLARSTGDVSRLRAKPSRKNQLIIAQGKQAADRLRSDTLGTTYQNALTSAGKASISTLTPATMVASDEHSAKQRALAIGGAAGLGVSGLLLTLFENRRRRVRDPAEEAADDDASAAGGPAKPDAEQPRPANDPSLARQ